MARDTLMKTSEFSLRAKAQSKEHAFQASRDLGQAIGNIPATFQQAKARELAMFADQMRATEYQQRIQMYAQEVAVRGQAAQARLLEVAAKDAQREYEKRSKSTASLMEKYQTNVLENPRTGAVQYVTEDSSGNPVLQDLPKAAGEMRRRKAEAEVTAKERGVQGSAEREMGYYTDILTADSFSGVTDEDKAKARRGLDRLQKWLEAQRPAGEGAQTPMDLPEFQKLPKSAQDEIKKAWGAANNARERKQILDLVRNYR